MAPLFFLTIILGNLLIIILEQIRFIDSEWHYGMFAVLMAFNICLLKFLMWKCLKKDKVSNAVPLSNIRNDRQLSKHEAAFESN